jgi:hypothetical protein
MSILRKASDVARAINSAVATTPVIDVHTHLYSPSFGPLMAWGVDEVLTYHYLVAEVFRAAPLEHDTFWKLDKRAQADLIWRKLFIENSPVSEGCRGPLTALKALGIGVRSRSLDKARAYFRKQTPERFTDVVFKLAGVKKVVMTNDPFDPRERAVWMKKGNTDSRFAAALRIDALLMNWPAAAPQLKAQGYRVRTRIDGATAAEVRRFLSDWIQRMGAVYMACSLPSDFAYPDKSARSTLLRHCVLSVAHSRGIPFAMMIGVNRGINPALRMAGDGPAPADVRVVEALCREHPDNRFLVTMLSRENQYQLCATARKFSNLMPFGCWWFLNTPGFIEEMTRMRVELLGLSFIPQHSDARVLDQLIYKWSHSRAIIAKVLVGKYQDLAAAGWPLNSEDIRRDVANLFGGNFERFLAETPKAK